MPQVAAWIDEAISAARAGDEARLGRVAAQVRDLLSAFPIPGWSG